MTMKKFFTLIGAALLAMSVNAQNTTLKILPFSIQPGEKKTVTLDLDNPGFDAASFSCGIVLPEGLDISKNKKNKYNITFNEEAERYDDHSISADLHEDGSVTIVCVSMSAAKFYENEGAILNIPIEASETASTGNVEIKITKQEITDDTGTKVVKPDTYITDVTIGTTGIKDVNANVANGDGKFVVGNSIIIKKAGKEYYTIGTAK